MKKRTSYKFVMSKGRQKAVVILILFIVGLFFTGDHYLLNPVLRDFTSNQYDITQADYQKYHNKTFTVVKVVDGDTLDVDIADGNYPTTRIRLWGVDTPETKHPQSYYGLEASEFAKKTTLGKDVTLLLNPKDTRGKYKRLLAYVQLEDGRVFNELLLSDGFAYADLRFKHDYYHKYKSLEDKARRQKKGLWENVTFEQLPQWRQERNPDLLNK